MDISNKLADNNYIKFALSDSLLEIVWLNIEILRLVRVNTKLSSYLSACKSYP